MTHSHQQEVDSNYSEFLKILPSIMAVQRNKFALMKNGKVLGYFSTAADASTAAKNFIDDGVFSVQQVTDAKVDLGFYNHAVPVS